ncbi:AhpD-like protein [Microdochium trichocladiopsis]|uniref:AhpD-like protein n=1 Tax=Microdochium trichocladiopsis TaxID=1682393 RepID=A0A9P8XX76_9PEZI|nr:AhpD-like protein [Microdochium trichocladiopsis]KAH7018147.1 AhpD-like protein [Microdochium trichocladiopsis]
MARIPYPPLPPAPKKDGTTTTPRPPPPNVSRVLAHSTGTATHWGAVANAHFTALQLDAKLRELAILLTTAKLGSTYEHTHHSLISAKFGVSDAQRAWIGDKARLAEGGVLNSVQQGGKEQEGLFTDKEKVLLVLVENVVERKDVGEELWKSASGFFGERELVEIVSLVGFYFTFSRITTVFEVELEGSSGSKL